MNHEEELKEKIGERNYDLLINEITKGLLTPQQVKDIGLRMDKTKQVNGIYEAKMNEKHELKDVMRHMLDMWWQVELWNTVDGLEALMKVLTHKDIGLHYLAQRMKPDLPTTFPDIPEQFQDENKTASKPFMSKQRVSVCASHGVALAVLELLDDFGYDADQKVIETALVDAVEKNDHPKNIDEFDSKRIKVCISKQDAEEEVMIELRVLTQWAKIDANKMTFMTEQYDDTVMNQRRKVLRWDIYRHICWRQRMSWTTSHLFKQL